MKRPSMKTRDEEERAASKLLRAFRVFEIFALAYNLEHGIIPAALPQIRHLYGTNGFLEALIQCVSVVGTQLGVCLVTTFRLPLRKNLLLSSIALIAVACLCTRLTSGVTHKGLPLWILFWRFAVGLFSSYPINLAPRWINEAFRADPQSRQAHVQIFSIFGTMLGYAFTLCSSPPSALQASYTPALSDHQATTDTFLGWASKLTHYLWVALTYPQDFRRAFLWAACFTGLAGLVALFLLDAEVLDEFGNNADEEGDEEKAVLNMLDAPGDWDTEERLAASKVPSLETPMVVTAPPTSISSVSVYYPHSLCRQNSVSAASSRRTTVTSASKSVHKSSCLLWMPLVNEVQSFIDSMQKSRKSNNPHRPQSTWRDIKELVVIPEYMGLVGCVWVNTTAAQAVNFWLFTAYTIGMGVPPSKATMGVGIVFVLGTLLGLYTSTRLEGFLTKVEAAEVEGISVPSRVLATMTCLSAVASLFGGGTFLVSGYWMTTAVFTLAVVAGAAVIPIAQAAVGSCAPPQLHETAYGLYQFVFQSTWFFGPLVPVFIGWIAGGTVETTGLKFVVLLPCVGVLLIFWAYKHRAQKLCMYHRAQTRTEALPSPLYTELVPLMATTANGH